MSIQEILKKAAKGEALTDEEKEFVKGYDPDKDESRIPKTRLDAEIAKRKEAEKKVDDLTTKLEEITVKVEELESKGMTETDKVKKETEKELAKLQKQVTSLTKERDDAQAQIKARDFSAEVGKLAAGWKFDDTDYLEHLISKKALDLKDENAVAAFKKELETSSPSHFGSDAKPGSGASPNKDAAVKPDAQKRIDELLAKKELTMKEVNEIVTLQESIKPQNPAVPAPAPAAAAAAPAQGV